MVIRLKKSYVLTNPKLLYKDKILEVKNIIEKLELLNPLNILNRGYSITYLNSLALKSVKEVKENDLLDIKLTDGVIQSKVINVKEDK